MTTTPTDDLPKLLGSLIREAFTARGFNGKDDDLLDLSALIERTASALADRQARAAQAEPVAWRPALSYEGYKQFGQWANGSPDDDTIEYWRRQLGVGIEYAYATPSAQPKAEPPLTESEQQSTAQPVAEAYQRGIVQGMNDVLHNGIDWARAKFGGAPLTAPPRTDAPALTEEALMLDIDGDNPLSDDLGAVWERAADAWEARMHPCLRGYSEWCGRVQAAVKVLIAELPQLADRALRTASKPSEPAQDEALKMARSNIESLQPRFHANYSSREREFYVAGFDDGRDAALAQIDALEKPPASSIPPAVGD